MDAVSKMAIRIFRAKCADIGVLTSSQREARFVAMVLQFCRMQKFVLSANGLGPKAAREIAKFLLSPHVYINANTQFTSLDLSGTSREMNPRTHTHHCTIASREETFSPHTRTTQILYLIHSPKQTDTTHTHT